MGMRGNGADGDTVPEDQEVVSAGLGAFEPTHVSHKRVEGYLIAAAEFEEDGSGKVGVDHPARGYIVVPVPPRFLRNPGDVAEGDYLVRYEPTDEQPHGYLSYSPRAVFEAGYSEIVPVEHRKSYEGGGRGLTFGQALEQLKDGDRIAREGWNGKGMWLALSGPLAGREIAAESFWSKPCSEFACLNGGSATVLPCINMKTATGEILMGWLASQTDMLAEDWMVVPADAA
ncbi:DUF2829 domain-containing protein [Methylobacterium fujisawaense]|uniref:DUF2829 domain-containing protein n=1 Tax=Methylobacterium fujisawaense TaxID=107400 RepID=UPI0031F57BF0